MEAFRKIREEIDSIIDASKVMITNETVDDSLPKIENARKLLSKLEQMAQGEIQDRIVANRVLALTSLTQSINTVLLKKARKKAKPQNVSTADAKPPRKGPAAPAAKRSRN